MPKVSIIIPIYNVAKYLDKCLESCCNQTFKDIEIICINDGSTDMSKEIVDKYAKKDNRIIAIHKKNEGVISARNVGLNIAKGEYIFLLDGDDNIPTDCIESLNDIAKKFNADIALGTINLVDNKGNIINWLDTQKTEVITNEEIFTNVMRTSFKSLCGKLIRKDLFNKIKIVPKNLKIGEDLVILFQIAIISKISVYTKNITYNYVQHGNSVINNSLKHREINPELISMIKFFIKILNEYKLNSESTALLKRQIIFGISRFVFVEQGYGMYKNLIKNIIYKHYIKDNLTIKLTKEFSKPYAYSIFLIYLTPKLWCFLYKLYLSAKQKT